MKLDRWRTELRSAKWKPAGWAILIFLGHTLLIHQAFFIRLAEINSWDEAIYMNNGRELLNGHLPLFAFYPLVTFIYALCYLFVQTSSTWMTDVWTISRILFFIMLWWSGFLVARRLARFARPAVFVGLMVVLPVIPNLFQNAAYSLFAAMSTFALWQFLSFNENRAPRHLVLTSLFLALGAMCRSEGFIIFALFSVMSLWLQGIRESMSIVRRCIAPFSAIIGGYVLVYGLATGNFELGTKEKSYESFEQGHGVAFASKYADRSACIEGQLEARSLFGTPEDNAHSTFRAILRNPPAYLSRIPKLTEQVSRAIYDRYGRALGVICLLFAARGVFTLVRGRHYVLLSALFSWGAYTLLYITLCYQAAALLMPFAIVISLAAIGISAAIESFNTAIEQKIWFFGLICTGVLLAIGTPNIETPIVLVVFAVALLAISVFRENFRRIDSTDKATETISYSMVFLALLAIKANYPVRQMPPVESAEEQSSAFMRVHLPANSTIGTWAPGVVWSSNMKPVTMERDFRWLIDDDKLENWIKREKVEGFFIDTNFRQYEPEVCAKIERQIGRMLRVAFTSRDRSCMVLVVQRSR